ncbi:neurotrypsin-like [Diadema setosum]|uniref:neurotrypsin-like n=1 Tax=Diadema setosum TaxID=31175 RepID=UPI003B3B11D4
MVKATLLFLILTIVTATFGEYEGNVRLVDGTSALNGRVEVFHDQQWGTVCDDFWSSNDAVVVCRQLGYTTAKRAVSNAYFGEGSADQPIHLDDVLCDGTESRLINCRHNEWGDENCEHDEDAGVECTNQCEGHIRLVGGSSMYEGRVEVNYYGVWGTVCDDGWGTNDAEVVCRQLGYPTTNAEAFRGATYGEGSGPILLANVGCYGRESNLADCSHRGWYNNDCGHNEDAGVRCGKTTSLTLFHQPSD